MPPDDWMSDRTSEEKSRQPQGTVRTGISVSLSSITGFERTASVVAIFRLKFTTIPAMGILREWSAVTVRTV